MLHPRERCYSMSRSDEVNNDSLVLESPGAKTEFSVLFTGDIGREAQEDLIHLGPNLKRRHPEGASPRQQVVVHGGIHSCRLSRSRCDQRRPRKPVRASSRGSPHGPAASQVLRTDRDGAVIVREGPGGGMRIETAASFAMKGLKAPQTNGRT
ncbi:MAG: hypothetical protein MZV70_02535 [Desulfobacterales bacterium]|nr:hypothetical protein [Desulfobacterales bacterium]